MYLCHTGTGQKVVERSELREEETDLHPFIPHTPESQCDCPPDPHQTNVIW